jgi:hypothetical protein
MVAQARTRPGTAPEARLADWDELVGLPSNGYLPEDSTAALRDAPEAAFREHLEAAVQLFRTPDAEGWFLELEECAVWIRRWMDMQNRLRLRGETSEFKEEQRGFVAEAAAALLTDDAVERYRARLLELARVLCFRREEAHARAAAAVALAIERGVPLSENPFFITLVQRTLQAGEALVRVGELRESQRGWRR